MSVRACSAEEAASEGIAWQGDPIDLTEADTNKVVILEADVPCDTEETGISEPPFSEEQELPLLSDYVRTSSTWRSAAQTSCWP